MPTVMIAGPTAITPAISRKSPLESPSRRPATPAMTGSANPA